MGAVFITHLVTIGFDRVSRLAPLSSERLTATMKYYAERDDDDEEIPIERDATTSKARTRSRAAADARPTPATPIVVSDDAGATQSKKKKKSKGSEAPDGSDTQRTFELTPPVDAPNVGPKPTNRAVRARKKKPSYADVFRRNPGTVAVVVVCLTLAMIINLTAAHESGGEIITAKFIVGSLSKNSGWMSRPVEQREAIVDKLRAVPFMSNPTNSERLCIDD